MSNSTILRSSHFAQLIARLSLIKKAEDVKVLDLRKLTSITDFFVICTGTSEKQVKAIADVIVETLEERKIVPWHKEGYGNLQWVLLDYVDVVVHVFQEETRQFYGLERLWGDAPVINVKDELD